MEAAEDEYSDDEKDRLSGGQGNRAGVGDTDGDGEEPLVDDGEPESVASLGEVGGLSASCGGKRL